MHFVDSRTRLWLSNGTRTLRLRAPTKASSTGQRNFRNRPHDEGEWVDFKIPIAFRRQRDCERPLSVNAMNRLRIYLLHANDLRRTLVTRSVSPLAAKSHALYALEGSAKTAATPVVCQVEQCVRCRTHTGVQLRVRPSGWAVLRHVPVINAVSSSEWLAIKAESLF